MVDFFVYDVGFLILFSAFVTWFLHSNKKDITREGIIFMYRTQLGIKAINYVGDKFKKTLNAIKYLIISVGFLLMIAMVWMMGKTVLIYLLHPEITKIVKAPPIAPLIPYFPKLFGMQNLFPPFYFTYFIVALAIVAIVHEFSHGIFMRLFKIKIKSTGLVFLGPILGAFVEEQKSNFEKKKITEQMTVLGAGVFANIIFALIFYGLYVAFFFSSFAASGYIYNTYPMAIVHTTDITGLSNMTNGLVKIKTADGNYYIPEKLASQINRSNLEYLQVYQDAPAVAAKMRGAIIQANDVKITGEDKLREFLNNKEPGQIVNFTTRIGDTTKNYSIKLGSRPDNSSKAYLGVGRKYERARGVIQNILMSFMSFKKVSTLYEPTWNSGVVYFIYYFLWWIMIINLLVALFNMLPLGILDGGRFFYLAMLGIFKSEKVAKTAYKVMTYAIILMFILMTFFWFIEVV